MSKFKVGDRVVLVRIAQGHSEFKYKYQTAIVLEPVIDINDEISVKFENGPSCGLFGHRFVSEDVYNSPLFKLMEED